MTRKIDLDPAMRLGLIHGLHITCSKYFWGRNEVES